MTGRAAVVLALAVAALCTAAPAAVAAGGPAAAPAPAPATPSAERHVIYLHGRIVQEQQKALPHHPRFGDYQLEAILQALRERGFVVHGGIRPRQQTVSAAADAVVAEVRRLLAAGVPADHVTVVGASMGASIAFAASARLQQPALRFAVLGACLSANASAVREEEGRALAGHILALREESDELSTPCPPPEAPSGDGGLVVREIVLHTGLGHGFIYRPLPEWLEPVVEWARLGR